MSLLPEVEFASFLVYAPQGTTPTSQKSKVICDRVKKDGFIDVRGQPKRAIPYSVSVLAPRIYGTDMEDWFVRRPVLVPAPRSSPVVTHGLFPTKIICDQMVLAGLGSEVRLLLERTSWVPKAAACKANERPTIEQQYETMRVNNDLVEPFEIVVVDDVVTRGTMSVACISRLKEAFPSATIRAFALIRTMSGLDVENVIEIARGTIYNNGKWGMRRP